MYLLVLDVVISNLQIEIEFSYLFVLFFKMRLRVRNLSNLQQYLINSLWAKRRQDASIQLVDSSLHQLALLLEKDVGVYDFSFLL